MAQIISSDDFLKFYAAFTSSDFEFMRARLHPDCVLGFPGSCFGGVIRGRDMIISMLTGIQQAMGGSLTFDCRRAWLQGNYGGVQWFTSGTPPHGGNYKNRGVVLFGLKDGLIIDFQDYFDTEIVAAFWPNGEPATDLSQTQALVEKVVTLSRI